MSDQAGGEVWVGTRVHPRGTDALVALHIPGQRPYYLRSPEAHKIGGDLIAAAVVAGLDAAIVRDAIFRGMSSDEAIAHLQGIGRMAATLDDSAPA